MSTTKHEQTCEERIQPELERVIECLSLLYTAIGLDDEEEVEDKVISEALNIRVEDITDEDRNDRDKIREEAQMRLDELPLSVNVKRVMTVQLSWGGPSDEFEVEINEKGELESNPVYVFKDWFDGARRETKDTSVERFLEYWAETQGGGQ